MDMLAKVVEVLTEFMEVLAMGLEIRVAKTS